MKTQQQHNIRFTPEIIENLLSHQVVVFGSNTEGRHGKGMALTAKQKFGAIYGVAKGIQGQSYAIITKDLSKGMRSVDLSFIKEQIADLYAYAMINKDKEFLVTKIGCSLAGFTEKEISELFHSFQIPNNVLLPQSFYGLELQKGQLNFEKDIVTGEKGEEFIKEVLIKRGMVFKKYNKDKRFDLEMEYKGESITYEIKTDVYKRDTGNIFIEFECRGVPSGIEVTEADFFVTFFPRLGEIWNIKTSELKKIISENKLKTTSFSGDEGSNTKGYLINKKQYRKMFKFYSSNKLKHPLDYYV